MAISHNKSTSEVVNAQPLLCKICGKTALYRFHLTFAECEGYCAAHKAICAAKQRRKHLLTQARKEGYYDDCKVKARRYRAASGLGNSQYSRYHHFCDKTDPKNPITIKKRKERTALAAKEQRQ